MNPPRPFLVTRPGPSRWDLVLGINGFQEVTSCRIFVNLTGAFKMGSWHGHLEAWFENTLNYPLDNPCLLCALSTHYT